MVGLEYCLKVVQKNGFFWEIENKEKVRDIFNAIGFKKVKSSAFRHIISITDLIEGRLSAQGLRMLKKLFLKEKEFDNSPEQERELREKIWAYRQWLMDFFDLPYPKIMNHPAYFIDDAGIYRSRKFSVKGLEEGLKDINPDYSFAGFIVRRYE